MIDFLKKGRTAICISFFVMLCLAAAGFYVFYVKLDGAVHKTNYSFMKEAANQQAISFNAKLDGQFNQLILYARSFENIDINDYTAVKTQLNVTKDFGDFKRISIANDIGVVINNDNTVMGNILKQDYYISAMNGEFGMSAEYVKDEADGEKVIILSAPIYKEKNVVGVILGTFGEETLSKLFDSKSFDGMGYSYVFTADGEVIAQSNTQKALIQKPGKIYDIISNVEFKEKDTVNKLLDDIKNNNSGIIEYSKNKDSRMAVYQPIGTHDWYLLSVVDVKYISDQSKLITGYVLALIGAVTVLFCIFIFVIYETIRINKKIMLKNDILKSNDERYKIANDIMKNVVFEYSYETNILYAMGNINPLFGSYSDYISIEMNEDGKKELIKKGLLFFDDMIKAAENKEVEFEKEYNFLCSDTKFRWIMFKATYVYNENEEPVKIIGSLTDIQEQKTEEEDLRRKAEIDQLTGILNKKSIEKYIEQTIERSSDKDIFAVYIIDLDNFKGVNDNLGHIFGDEVLMNVGRKMKNIFRDTDYVGRIGGDEFLAFLNYGQGTEEDAMKVVTSKAEKLCNDFRETYTGKNRDYKISASIGIAVYPKDGKSYMELYEKADKALYNSKRKGKDSFSIYEEI